MGCDIHCYIEYKTKGSDRWFSFGGRINPGRNYEIFAKMAGVRSYIDITPISEPRGLPSDVGFAAEDDNQLYILENGNEVDEGCISRERAEQWVSAGISQIIKEHWISDPDWHSHSWLTPTELKQVLSEFDLNENIEYFAILKVLNFFEESNHPARLIFWFDN